MIAAVPAPQPVGDLLRTWRQRRHLSQLALALEADVSARHLSFLETGRARPSREMLLRLAEPLEIPLRDQNTLLVSAGFAPVYPERNLDDPALQAAREAVDLVLAGHEPFPALAIDRHWTLVAANQAVPPLLVGIDPALAQPPVNVLRVSLHPAGLAPRIENFAEWRAHVIARLRRQVEVSADPTLAELLEELSALPVHDAGGPGEPLNDQDVASVVVPLRLRTERGPLAFFSTTTIFGTPVDVTLAELAIECFYPADQATKDVLLRGVEDAAGHR